MYYYLLKNKDEPILDIGCRDGHMLSLLKEDGYKELYGIDIVENPLHYEHIRYSKCDANDMSMFEDSKFKIVILSHVLEHIETPQKVIDEIHRILKPDGILYIEVPLETEVKPEVGHFTFFKKPKNLYKLLESKFEVIEDFKDIKKKDAIITRVWLRTVTKRL